MPKAEIEQELLSAATGEFPQSAERLRVQLELLTTLTAAQNTNVRQNTDALVQNTVSKASSGSTVASASKSILGTLGAGLFLSPLISGVVKLFGGSKKEEPAPLVPLTRTAPTGFEAALGSGRTGFANFDYDQQGLPRTSNPPPSQNVTIQINALDSRSIMDRSDDIARALREAMLHSHSINDVIGEV